MKEHRSTQELLPLLAAGQLDPAQQAAVEAHLADCPQCQADLALWQGVSTQVQASSREAIPPAGVLEAALERVDLQSRRANPLRQAWQLLLAQARLVQRELWPACAVVIALGLIVALLSDHSEVLYFLAPLVAAAGLATLFNPESDPAYELALATPTSPWKVLLARLSVVSSYNLALSLAASLALLPLVSPDLLGSLILGWLAPMACLSTLALLLSLWIGTNNAVALTYLLWMAQYTPYQAIGAWARITLAYQAFWHSPALLLVLSLALTGAALWSVQRAGRSLSPQLG